MSDQQLRYNIKALFNIELNKAFVSVFLYVYFLLTCSTTRQGGSFFVSTTRWDENPPVGEKGSLLDYIHIMT